MRIRMRIVAGLQLVGIFPAALFLTSVLVGAGDPPQYELAHIAHRIAGWYSGRMWPLWLLLVALPMAVLVAGCGALTRVWRADADVRGAARQSLSTIPAPLATLVVGGTTMIAAGILAIVVLHIAAN